MTGSRAYTNLDGSPQYDTGERAMAFSSTFNPISPKFIPKVNLKLFSSIRPLNASQFSKLFKGTFIARAQPTIRGFLNRTLNKSIDNVNNVNTYKTGVKGSANAINNRRNQR